jgi:hypothetical protein
MLSPVYSGAELNAREEVGARITSPETCDEALRIVAD